MARPTMKTTELGAAPQMADPISKRTMVLMKMALTEKNVYSFPNINWNAHVVSMKALPYQPTSSSEWKSSVICGMACRGCQSTRYRQTGNSGWAPSKKVRSSTRTPQLGGRLYEDLACRLQDTARQNSNSNLPSR